MTPRVRCARDLLIADWALLDDYDGWASLMRDIYPNAVEASLRTLYGDARRAVVTDLPLIRDVLVGKLMAKVPACTKASDLKNVMVEMRLSTAYHESDDVALSQVKESLDIEEQEWLEALRSPEELPEGLEAELAELAGMPPTAPASRAT